jgi:hypothetical protein
VLPPDSRQSQYLQDFLELQALLEPLALPREARDSSICNELAPGLGKMPGIELQGVSVAAPKLFGADRSVRPRVQ